MNRSFLPFALAGAFALSNPSAQAQALQPALPTDVIITVPADPAKYGKAKKFQKKRFQIWTDSTSISLRLGLADQLPLKKVKLATEVQPRRSDYVSFNLDSMAGFIRAEQREAWNTLLEMQRATEKTRPAYEKEVEHFIEGKRAGRMFSQWHTLAKVPLTAETVSIKAKVRAGLFLKPVLTLDTLPGVEPSLLPAVDTDPCEPFDRYFARRKLKGFGIEKFRYKPYIRTEQKMIRKSFEVYFERNRAQADLTEIAQFLRANDLTIVHASMEGFSSVEGTAERNRILQKQRARRMMYALQSFNNEPVQSDTILFSDAWEPFREELRRSPYASMDALDNESLRETINLDPVMMSYFEPYLSQHRKATLNLTLAGRLDRQEIVKRLVFDFNHELSKVKAGDSPMNRELEANLLGMLDYYEKLSFANPADSLNIAQLVDESSWPAEARLLHFYHVIKKHEEQKNDNFSWDSTFVRRGWNNIFTMAARNAIAQVEGHTINNRFSSTYEEKKKRLEQLVDVQYYTFKYIQEGVLDPDVLCAITYPNSPKYHGYKLNQLAMAYDLSKTRYFTCFGFGPRDPTPKFKLRADSASMDSLVSAAEAAGIPHHYGQSSHIRTYNVEEKGAYYFFVKTLALDGDASIKQFVQTSDNYFEFDLFYLLRLNVSNWDPFANHFYDKDIDLKQMRKLVTKLKSIERHICPENVNQLYLDFYMKSLYYLTYHRTPGDTPEMNLAEQSMRGIATYYAKRPRMLYPRLSMYVVKQLHTFYWLPTRKSSVAYAFDVMSAADSRRLLSDEEQEIWNTYLKLYKQKYRSYRPRDERDAVPKSIVSKTAVAGN